MLVKGGPGLIVIIEIKRSNGNWRVAVTIFFVLETVTVLVASYDTIFFHALFL